MLITEKLDQTYKEVKEWREAVESGIRLEDVEEACLTVIQLFHEVLEGRLIEYIEITFCRDGMEQRMYVNAVAGPHSEQANRCPYMSLERKLKKLESIRFNEKEKECFKKLINKYCEIGISTDDVDLEAWYITLKGE